MEAKSLVSHQHSWWFYCFSLREKLAGSHNKIKGIDDALDFYDLSLFFKQETAKPNNPVPITTAMVINKVFQMDDIG